MYDYTLKVKRHIGHSFILLLRFKIGVIKRYRDLRKRKDNIIYRTEVLSKYNLKHSVDISLAGGGVDVVVVELAAEDPVIVIVVVVEDRLPDDESILFNSFTLDLSILRNIILLC